MANNLPREKQLLCLKMLCEGNSIRAVERTAGVHRDTIMRLMVRFGEACQAFLDETVRHVDAKHLEIDEQWTWVAKKQRNCSIEEHATGEVGDQYLFLALDQKTGLIACHDIGKRTGETTHEWHCRSWFYRVTRGPVGQARWSRVRRVERIREAFREWGW